MSNEELAARYAECFGWFICGMELTKLDMIGPSLINDWLVLIIGCGIIAAVWVWERNHYG